MINASGIIGTGAYLPSKKLNNLELGKICKVSPKILKKTGIKFRRIAQENETASSMGIMLLFRQSRILKLISPILIWLFAVHLVENIYIQH